jgi:hypothetical protein
MLNACTRLPSVACPSLPYVSTLSHIRHDFRKKLLNIKCVFYHRKFYLKHLILRITERDSIINVFTPSCKVLVTLVRFQFILASSTDLKNTQISDFMKIRTVCAKLLHADIQTHERTDGRREKQT